MRILLRVAAAVACLVALGALLVPAGGASAQRSSVEVVLEAGGVASASLTVNGTRIPVPVPAEHPYGWTGEGRWDVIATGGCRIVVNGAVAIEDSRHCQYPPQ